ncbi:MULTISPECIES: DUF1800 domain-containing protein [Niastella]|uniref:DUF1800 domain-containing protein n=1 Tax=Niastella soli TaxID=2821487 RepID=A0ABS3YMC3_9BACT|nr:DUF1800 domain-containing protein [Niastella soli]MBO9199035.1 DUF1800 domain-containing protein [Niastella soli]
MDRREFFTLKRKAKAPSAQTFGLRQIYSGLAPQLGNLSAQQAAHLLKRTMFGATKADIDHFTGMSIATAVSTLLNVPAGLPAPPVKNYDNTDIEAGDPDLTVAQGATWVNTVSKGVVPNFQRGKSIKCWWLGQMINQETNIREKMTMFWHNHWTSEINVIERPSFAYEYSQLLRQDALGNFKKMVKDVTLNKCMLRYLNGYLNSKNAPDENYARELQELFTLGKENNPNYTEEDVKAAARVLTGWKLDMDTELMSFKPEDHDKNSKTFSSFYNGTVIAGRSDATGADAEVDDLINMIFAKTTEVSEFIVKKLYRWFVYYTIEADTYTNVIKPLAQTFVRSGWEIKPVLEQLLSSEHFFDPLSQGCLIKSPLDLIVGMVREFKVVFPDASDYVNQYGMWDFLQDQSAKMQQDICDPPNVAGWPAYYQIPMFHETWINHDTMPRRSKLSDQLILTGYMRNTLNLVIDPVAFTRQFPNAGDPNLLISDVMDVLYRVPVSDARKATIKSQILLTGQTTDSYWTDAWNNPAELGSVTTRLQTLYKYLMTLAEYQLA